MSLPYSQELPCLCLEVSACDLDCRRGQRNGGVCVSADPIRLAGLARDPRRSPHPDLSLRKWQVSFGVAKRGGQGKAGGRRAEEGSRWVDGMKIQARGTWGFMVSSWGFMAGADGH